MNFNFTISDVALIAISRRRVADLAVRRRRRLAVLLLLLDAALRVLVRMRPEPRRQRQPLEPGSLMPQLELLVGDLHAHPSRARHPDSVSRHRSV